LFFSGSLFELAVSPVEDTGARFVHRDSLFVSETQNTSCFFRLRPQLIVIDAVCKRYAAFQELVVIMFTAVDQESF
jgi:hypothetical protein